MLWATSLRYDMPPVAERQIGGTHRLGLSGSPQYRHASGCLIAQRKKLFESLSEPLLKQAQRKKLPVADGQGAFWLSQIQYGGYQ
ncbi:MAG: hypothetical protein KDI12_18240 [Anaerolineae bacterium]|nr:hypothetical protein [Anaerolineae bacterium]HRX01888.1 hypothetical protein [Anaerolineae bacterium]